MNIRTQKRFTLGQKWLSIAEPDLGLGKVVGVDGRTVSLYFDKNQEKRAYAHAQAPITRVKFSPGDEIKTQDNKTVIIKKIKEQDGLYLYIGECKGERATIIETELDVNTTFSQAEERFLTKQLDDSDWFNLRYHTLKRLAKLAEAKSRGLYGARVSTIPHQLYIANEVAQRFAPRVLLADEVGLGKTIEAGLIIHHQLQTSRALRILVIVPHSLTFQWFIELIRRFNLRFTMLDEERCCQIESDNAAGNELSEEQQDIRITNPFDAQQLVLCSLDLFLNNDDRLSQVLTTNWDLVVVDEAHHLQWSPKSSSREYEIIEKVSRITKGLLLLTATPEQLGEAGHFARLRLLDPHRFHNYENFKQEQANFQKVAKEAQEMLASGISLNTANPPNSEDDTNQKKLKELLDRHGTGRVLFRNVRSSIQGFPKRILYSYSLSRPAPYHDYAEFYPELRVPNWFDFDPRVDWLINQLLESTPLKSFSPS